MGPTEITLGLYNDAIYWSPTQTNRNPTQTFCFSVASCKYRGERIIDNVPPMLGNNNITSRKLKLSQQGDQVVTNTMSEHSFRIQPDCNKEYAPISELLSTEHSISLFADSEYTPLIYQFGYNDSEHKYYLHSSIYLTIGNYDIFGNEVHAKSSVLSSFTVCEVTAQSYTQYLDFEQHISEPYYLSSELSHSFLFQQTNHYIQYLFKYNNDQDCATYSLVSILDLLHIEFVEMSGNNILCEISKTTICLSETVNLSMKLNETDNDLI